MGTGLTGGCRRRGLGVQGKPRPLSPSPRSEAAWLLLVPRRTLISSFPPRSLCSGNGSKVSRGMGGRVGTAPNSRGGPHRLWGWNCSPPTFGGARSIPPEPSSLGALLPVPTPTLTALKGAPCRTGKPRLGGSCLSAPAQALLPPLPAPPPPLHTASNFKSSNA